MYSFTVSDIDSLTENAPYPRCHSNLALIFPFSLIQRDELPLTNLTVSAMANEGWILEEDARGLRFRQRAGESIYVL